MSILNDKRKIRKVVLFIMPITALILIGIIFYTMGFYTIVRYEISDKKALKINLLMLTPGITSIIADNKNEILFEAKVTDADDNPIPAAKVIFEEANHLGTFTYFSARTSLNGDIAAKYSPSDQASCLVEKQSLEISISAKVSGTDNKSVVNLKLIRVPVIFLHGYKASPAIFGSFRDYLKAEGFMTSSLDYNSGKGVASGATELSSFLDLQTREYYQKGILARRFDIIAHSMGGLVGRYYSSSRSYLQNENIDRIIFLSTPQKGSPFASLGLKYYKDQGIHDLIPESDLFTKTFPQMINHGLNNEIRYASILGKYDEVVSLDSASLEKWGIKTELFEVGENNFTVDKLLTGKIVEATNHKLVLENRKVFSRVRDLLLSNMPYPEKIN